MVDRQTRLLELLVAEERLEVRRIAELLGVSQVTVRKDLDTLAARGLVRREHGVAELLSQKDPTGQLAYHARTKRQIAQLAARTVHDGETVMIESGPCCAMLAEILATEKQNVTIITNSFFVAGHIHGKGSANIVVIGGVYQQDSHVLVGQLVKQCVDVLHVNKLFIGIGGFDGERGFMGDDLMRAEAVRSMAKRADRTLVLTESDRFLQEGVASMLPVKAVHSVYTDADMPTELAARLAAMGILIFRADGHA